MAISNTGKNGFIPNGNDQSENGTIMAVPSVSSSSAAASSGLSGSASISSSSSTGGGDSPSPAFQMAGGSSNGDSYSFSDDIWRRKLA